MTTPLDLQGLLDEFKDSREAAEKTAAEAEAAYRQMVNSGDITKVTGEWRDNVGQISKEISPDEADQTTT